MSAAPIRFAVIGYGFIGQRHAAIIAGHPNCELVAIVEPITDRQIAARENHTASVFDNAEELFEADLQLHVATIATPNDSHPKLAEQMLQARLHVVIEKPMGLSSHACQRVEDIAVAMQRQVFCVMQNRYTPTAKWLRQMVDEQRLGELVYVGINCFWNRDARYYTPGGWRGTKQQDGGTLFTQFSHFVDLMYWLFGPIRDIQASVSNITHPHIEIEDTGHAIFSFERGGKGGLQFSTAVWDQNQESSVTIVGSHGSLRIGGQYMNTLEYCHIDGIEPPTLAPANPPNDYGAYKGSSANHHFVFENVVRTLQGNATPDATAAEGRAVVDMIEQIYAAAVR